VRSGKGSFSAAKGLYGDAIRDRMSHINLRPLANYGDDPVSWLTLLTESLFMVFLGTVRDTGIRSTGLMSKMCCDALYDSIEEFRIGFPEPIGPGLNSTWSLVQGYRTNPNSLRNRCCNKDCQRPVMPKKHPLFCKNRFASYELEMPADVVICINCLVYSKRHSGASRPQEFELRRLFRDANSRSHCMWGDCKKPLQYTHWLSKKPPGTDNGWIAHDEVVTGGQYIWSCDHHMRSFRKARAQRLQAEAEAASTGEDSGTSHSTASGSNTRTSCIVGEGLPSSKRISPRDAAVEAVIPGPEIPQSTMPASRVTQIFSQSASGQQSLQNLAMRHEQRFQRLPY